MPTQKSQPNGAQNGNGEAKETLVMGRTSQGVEIHATVVRLSRYAAVFEIYNLALVLRTSEGIENFKIVVQERTLYFGKAVIRSLINVGPSLVCEATVTENSWRDVQFGSETVNNGLAAEFQQFV